MGVAVGVHVAAARLIRPQAARPAAGEMDMGASVALVAAGLSWQRWQRWQLVVIGGQLQWLISRSIVSLCSARYSVPQPVRVKYNRPLTAPLLLVLLLLLLLLLSHFHCSCCCRCPQAGPWPPSLRQCWLSRPPAPRQPHPVPVPWLWLRGAAAAKAQHSTACQQAIRAGAR